jgi:hypothetical protein
MADLQRALATVCVLACMASSGCGSEDGMPSPKTERPADGSAAAESQLTSEIPISKSEEASIRDQVEQNWNLGELAGSPNLAGIVVELRVPDGTITKVEVMNDEPDVPEFRQVAESAMRAVMISNPLKLPPGKYYPAMRLRFYPDKVIQ